MPEYIIKMIGIELVLEEAQEELVAELQTEQLSVAAAVEAGDLLAYSDLVVQFPGLLNDTDVNGADLVDWVTGNLERFKLMERAAKLHAEATPEQPAIERPSHG